MASPLVGRTPTCLACLRRVTSTTAAPHAGASVSIGLTQVRGGKSMQRPKEAGVVIRLLKDVSYFGKEGSIFRTEAGRMRNHFFPCGKAEYLTRQRMAELGVTKNDIGQRDSNFRVKTLEVEYEIEDAVDAVAFATPNDPFAGLIGGPGSKQKRGPTAAHAVEVEQLAPSRALELLNTLVPETLTFERRLVHAPAGGKQSPAATTPESAAPETATEAEAKAEEKDQEPKKPLTPMQAHRARLQAEADKAAAEKQAEKQAKAAEKQAEAAARAAEAEAARAAETTPEERERERQQREREAEERLRFHGSVSLRDVAAALKERMLLDPEASRIHIRSEDLAFVGGPGVAGLDKVEKIGTFEVEIRALVGKYKVAPIRRKIEVVPL